MNYRISYLVAVYNKEEYICECVDSILAEDEESIEIEICIVDDGSTDNSYDVLIKNYSNYLGGKIKLESFAKNKGKNSAYNRAYELSTGQFICVFGADDVVVKGRTKILLENSLKYNKSIYGGLIKYNKDLSLVLNYSKLSLPSFYEISIDNYLSGGCGFYFKDHVEGIFPIPENLNFEDWWISYFLIKNNNCYCIDDFVTKYRIHGSNDCGVERGSYNSLKKNYLRHIDYISAFMSCDQGNSYLSKSMALRESYLYGRSNRIVFTYPFDIISLKIILFNIFDAKLVYSVYSWFRKVRI